jgi:hypothetical protein
VNVTASSSGGAPPAEFVPYIHGATLGRPSRARPERVLARLKTITGIWQEGALPGSGGLDGRSGRVTARGAVPAGPSRNGMPAAGGYVYRGSGESKSPTEAAGALGLRVAVPPNPRRKPAERERRPDCKAPKPDHLVICSQAPVLVPAALSPEPEPEPVSAPVPAPKPGPTRRGAALATACPGCGRPKPGRYVTCGGPCLAPRQAPEPVPEPEPEQAPVPAARCGKCRYLTSAIGHKLACGVT